MNSTQYSIITHMGKEPGKDWNMYVQLNDFSVYLKLMQKE